jgi:hydrogenase expression/formation protein HypC
MAIPVSATQMENVAHRESDADHACRVEEGCITCGDVALPLTVVAIDEPRGLALCEDEQGRRETVETALVLPVAAGDRLLVHAGAALTKLDGYESAGVGSQ